MGFQTHYYAFLYVILCLGIISFQIQVEKKNRKNFGNFSKYEWADLKNRWFSGTFEISPILSMSNMVKMHCFFDVYSYIDNTMLPLIIVASQYFKKIAPCVVFGKIFVSSDSHY